MTERGKKSNAILCFEFVDSCVISNYHINIASLVSNSVKTFHKSIHIDLSLTRCIGLSCHFRDHE